MALQFHSLKIKNIKRETDKAVAVTFEVPENLKEEFEYKQGQYITLKVPLEGKDNRRAFSVSSSPVKSDDITVAIKEHDDGFVSKFMNSSIKEGEHLEVMKPMGNFTIEMNEKNERTYVLFGGGSGITPLMSILTTALYAEPKSKVYLFYANSHEDDIIFKDELDELENEFKDRLNIVHFISRPKGDWEGQTGRIDKETAKRLVKEEVDADIKECEYFLCGPQGLMQQVKEGLEELDIPKQSVHRENFEAPLPGEAQSAVSATEAVEDVEEEELKERKIKVILYNDEHELEVGPDDTVLSAAQDAGLDPPFSCQIGACATCQAKLESGKVWMEHHDALTDEEVEEGNILTCQSHPLTDDVVVNYDEF